MSDVTSQVAGRACGSCTLCCKVMGIKELQKPAGTWCTHCAPGKGCQIYDARPAECRSFNCYWLMRPEVGPEWKPDHSKIVLAAEGGGIVAYVDPGFPSAWRNAPYLPKLRELALQALARGTHVLVSVNRRITVILPGKEVYLGEVRDDQQIAIEQRGSDLTAHIVDAASGAPRPSGRWIKHEGPLKEPG